MRKIFIIVSILFMSGCSWFKPYTQPIQQGNVFKDAQVNQLKIGMPEFKVKQIMGNPVLVNAFSDNRLDYVYTFKNRTDTQQKKIILTFKNKQLSNISK